MGNLVNIIPLVYDMKTKVTLVMYYRSGCSCVFRKFLRITDIKMLATVGVNASLVSYCVKLLMNLGPIRQLLKQI